LLLFPAIDAIDPSENFAQLRVGELRFGRGRTACRAGA